jgi:hypothetical protein
MEKEPRRDVIEDLLKHLIRKAKADGKQTNTEIIYGVAMRALPTSNLPELYAKWREKWLKKQQRLQRWEKK